MPAPCRIGDKDSSGETIVDGSSNVFINGKGVALVGSKDTHKPPEIKIEGSPSVFINGKAVVRVGDKDTHRPPHKMVEGSPDVVIA